MSENRELLEGIHRRLWWIGLFCFITMLNSCDVKDYLQEIKSHQEGKK